MEQATAGKAPPPIAINSGGGIQILNMNAVRAAAVGATVVPSPGSAQTATVVGSPGPPKAVGPRMLHITPQMLAAANARPGAPVDESDCVKSCDDEQNASKFEQACAPSASITGVTSDLRPCDNYVNADECEEGEIIRDSVEDSFHKRNHSTSDDHHNYREKVSDSHDSIESEKDLSSSAGESTGQKPVTVVGSSISINERSDPSHNLDSTSSDQNKPSPPADPDPYHSPVVCKDEVSSNCSNSSSCGAADIRDFQVLDKEEDKMNLEGKESGEGSRDLGSCSSSKSSFHLNFDKDSSNEGAHQVELISPKREIEEDRDSDFENIGAHNVIEEDERRNVEDCQNNNNSDDVVQSEFCLYDKNVNSVATSPKPDQDTPTIGMENFAESESSEKERMPLSRFVSFHQPCVQQDSKSVDDSSSSKALPTLADNNNCDIVESGGRDANVQSVITVTSGLDDVSSRDNDNHSNPRVIMSNSNNSSSEENFAVTEASPEEPTPPSLVHGDRNCENGSLENERNKVLRRVSSSSVDPVDTVDDVNLDMFPETSQPPTSSASDKVHVPPPSFFDGDSGSAYESRHQQQEVDVLSRRNSGTVATEKGTPPTGDEDNRPKLMDMNLADYFFMDVDDESGHRPWNSIQSTTRPPAIQKRSEQSYGDTQCNMSQQQSQSNVDNSSSLELQLPVTSPSTSVASQLNANKYSSNISGIGSHQLQPASCAFQMYTIGQGQGQSLSHSRSQIPSNSTNHPRIAARIPPRSDLHNVQQHPSYPYPNIRPHQPGSFHNSSGVNVMASDRQSGISFSPTTNRANVIASNSFTSPAESEYKNSHSQQQQQQQQRCFTTDPQLHSQYVQYTQNFPVSQDKNFHLATAATKSATVPTNTVTNIRPQVDHENLSKPYPSSRQVLVMPQFQHQHQPQYQQQQMTPQRLATGQQSQQQSYLPAQSQYQQNASASGYQNNSLQQSQFRHSSISASANGCENTTYNPSKQTSLQTPATMQQVSRVPEYASKFPAKFCGTNQLPSSLASRQIVPGNSTYYHSQRAVDPASHTQSQTLQVQQQQSISQLHSRELVPCSYNNPASSLHPGGIVQKQGGTSGYSGTGGTSLYHHHQQQQQQNYSTLAAGSSLRSTGSQSTLINANYPGHGNHLVRPPQQQQQHQQHFSAFRPAMSSSQHSTAFRTPAASGSVGNTGNWNAVPIPSRPTGPGNVRQQQFLYPTQNLGRPQMPHQSVDKFHHTTESVPTATENVPSSFSTVPSSQQQEALDQRRTISVIAPPPRYAIPQAAGNSSFSIPQTTPPYRSSTQVPHHQGTNQQRLQQNNSSTSLTSPQTLRNPQFVAHYKNTPNETSSLGGLSNTDNRTHSAGAQSVIRPNIYTGGGILTATGNSASSINFGGQIHTSSSSNRQAYSSTVSSSNSSSGGSFYCSGSSNQASVICAPQNSSGSREHHEQQQGQSSYSASAVSKDYQTTTNNSSSIPSSLSSSGSGYFSGELTLKSFLSHPSAPFLCPPSLSQTNPPTTTSPSAERSGTTGSGCYGKERVWERPYTSRSDQSMMDQEQYPFSSCQYSDAMRRYNSPITLQALSGLQPGANHLLVKTENGQFQLVSVRMQSSTAAAAAPGTPVPSTVAAPPTSMSIAQQLPSNSPLPLPPHSSGSPLAPPISSSIITTTTIPPHPSQQGRIITSSSSNHIGTSWSSSNNNSLVNNNSTTSSTLPIITSSAAHPPPPPHLVPPLPSSTHPSPLPPHSVPSSVIMPPNISASNSQLLISTANNISSSTSSSTFSTAAQAAVAAAQAAFNQHRAPHPVVVSSVPPPGGPQGPPPPVGAQPTGPHPNAIPPSGSMNSIPQGASVIRTGILGSNNLPPPPPPIVVSTSTSIPIANSLVTSSVVTSSHHSNLAPAAALTGAASFRPQSNTSQVPNNNATNNAQQNSGLRIMMPASNSISVHHPYHHNHPPYSQLHPPPPPQAPPSAYASNNIIASSTTTANTVSQMSNETAKNKCKNFLSFLLELSAKQNQTVARNVKNLIQGLIDGKVNEENFADRLQKEVNSQPQPCLVGFLKKSLPHLRHSLATNELKIDGIKSPPLSTFVPPAPPVSALVPQIPPPPPTETIRKKPTKQTPPVRPTTPTVPPSPVRILTPPVNSASPSSTPNPSSASSSGPSAPPTTTASPSSSKSSKPSKGGSSKSKSSAASSNASSGGANSSSSGLGGTPSSKSSIPSLSKSGKEKEKKDKTFSSSGYSADDDINDVAAMGGVNLAEESQRILGSTEYVGTQIRSCRDEALIQASPIIAKFKVIAAKYGLEETPSSEISALLSHAVEERLKTMIEKLSVIAEHRMDVIKLDERYEITQDVKGQLRFLEELDKLEKKRHDEQEREMLIRAAKSRSKSEDPEQAKLKAKAKEMQRVQLEEMRQRDANLTALQAIGPRKKPKLDLAGGSHGSAVPNLLGATGASTSLGRPQMALRPRLKRVNLRDLLFLLEHDKETMRSPFLYKNLLLK